MENRVNVYTEGAGGRTTVGQATAVADMRCRIHNRSGGSASTENELSPTDFLKIVSVANDIVTIVSDVSAITFTEYAWNVFVKSTDTVLNSGDDWPTAAGHFPFVGGDITA